MQPQENPSVNPDFATLQKNILDRRATEREARNDIKPIQPVEHSVPELREAPLQAKKVIFMKDGQTFELDEDAEFEMSADKRAVKMTLRELKERAAGDIAVKNRMHSLAEEKKKVQGTLSEFARMAQEDPLAALEYISDKARDADSKFEYKKYLNALAEQAEKLGDMDEKDRKNYDLEKKLKATEQDLSLKERAAEVASRKAQILAEHTEIGDLEFGEMVDAVLQNPELAEGIESESDVMDVVESLIVETLTQRDIINVVRDIDPDYELDNEFIFSLSDQMRQNPDLDEEDMRDIIAEVIKPSERARASRILSEKQRYSAPVQQQRVQGSSNFDRLKQKLIERNEKQRIKR